MTKIEWTEKTWNPLAGCTVKSEGCINCYAINMAYRLQAIGNDKYNGLTRKSGGRLVWTGKINFDEKALLEPFKRKKPTKYFVNSMSDLFHDNVSDEMIDKVFAVMAMCGQHTFQVLTKRPKRMREYFTKKRSSKTILSSDNSYAEIFEWIGCKNIAGGQRGQDSLAGITALHENRPIPNVWLGVSIEDQKTANERIPILLDTPAAIRWVSAEPLLGPVDLSFLHQGYDDNGNEKYYHALIGQNIDAMLFECEKIDWVVVGGESGSFARPMHLSWVHGIKNQCEAANVPFLFKQWGEFSPTGPLSKQTTMVCECGWSGNSADGLVNHTHECEARTLGCSSAPVMNMYKVGKKKAGRLLNGRLYDQYPVEV